MQLRLRGVRSGFGVPSTYRYVRDKVVHIIFRVFHKHDLNVDIRLAA